MRKHVFIALRMSGIAGQEKLSGIFRFLGENHDWDLTLARTAAEFSPDQVAIRLGQHYDGFIVSIPDTENSVSLLAKTATPTVIMDIRHPQLSSSRKRIAFIYNSPAAIGEAAAQHLLSIGKCRSYAFVHNPSILRWSIDRCQAFRNVLRENGCWCHEVHDLHDILELERPIGIFAANDDCGYDVIEFCHAHKIQVPDEAAILGLNNDTLICENCHPKLSSIQPDFEQEGFLAAKILSEMMSGKSKIGGLSSERTAFVGIKAVIRRDSTAEISNSGKLVQKALAYIRRNALRGISVDDVAGHLKVSRRLADLRFRELQGTTIGATIINLRLEEVKRRLRMTKEPIDSIAAACGYENPNYLKNLFKRRFAMTMSDFRSQAH